MGTWLLEFLIQIRTAIVLDTDADVIAINLLHTHVVFLPIRFVGYLVNYNAHPVTSITFPHSSANIRPLVIRHNSYSVAYLFIYLRCV
jgi:hypothetical protein